MSLPACSTRKLQEINSDYEAKRFHDVTLQHLEIVKAKPGLFNDWLKSKGKLGGQHKIPRLSNSRKNIDEMLDDEQVNHSFIASSSLIDKVANIKDNIRMINMNDIQWTS